MNILFICTANRDRSRTAEHFFQEKYPKFNFYSAGIDEALCSKSKGRFVDYQICDYADRIVCMEQRHAQFILDLLFTQHFFVIFDTLVFLVEDVEEC